MAGRQGDASPRGLRARDGVGLALPLIVLLIGAGLRIASRPKRHFDEHLFQNVAQHIVDVGLPIDSYAFPDRPYLFFDHTPLYVYFLAALTALGGPTVLIARCASGEGGPRSSPPCSSPRTRSSSRTAGSSGWKCRCASSSSWPCGCCKPAGSSWQGSPSRLP